MTLGISQVFVCLFAVFYLFINFCFCAQSSRWYFGSYLAWVPFFGWFPTHYRSLSQLTHHSPVGFFPGVLGKAPKSGRIGNLACTHDPSSSWSLGGWPLVIADLLGPEGKKNPGLSSRASSVYFSFPTKLFLSGTSAEGSDLPLVVFPVSCSKQ